MPRLWQWCSTVALLGAVGGVGNCAWAQELRILPSAAGTATTVDLRSAAADDMPVANADDSAPAEIAPDQQVDQPLDEADRAADEAVDAASAPGDELDAADSDGNQSAGEESDVAPAAPQQVGPELPPLSNNLRGLRNRVRNTLAAYYQRRLNSSEHNPWEMMHAIIAYGVKTQIHRGSPRGANVNAISYMCANGPAKGIRMLYIDRGRVAAQKGPYVQGHHAQLLAILAQSRVKIDYPLWVSGKQFTINDLLETEKLTCSTGQELTFKLIAFSHYCDSDMTWKNNQGEDWDIPKLIDEELQAPILSNAACGGTHRLTGLAYAVRNRAKQGKPIDGAWLRAQTYLNDYHRYTFGLQNSDGSFSTEWFRKREADADVNRRLQTTGHIFEWLVYSLPAEQLDDPHVIRAANYLTSLLADREHEWEIGPLGHAIHSLAIYDERRFKPFDGKAASVAQKARPTASVPAARPQPRSRSVRAMVGIEPEETAHEASEADAAASSSGALATDDSVPAMAKAPGSKLPGAKATNAPASARGAGSEAAPGATPRGRLAPLRGRTASPPAEEAAGDVAAEANEAGAAPPGRGLKEKIFGSKPPTKNAPAKRLPEGKSPAPVPGGTSPARRPVVPAPPAATVEPRRRPPVTAPVEANDGPALIVPQR